MNLTPPVIVLVRTQLSENIGSAARAMINFGALELRLVAPWGYDRERAETLACDGIAILDHVTIFPDLRSALADCNFSLATSRRLRRIQVPQSDPKTAVARIRSLPAGCRAALVFGGEQSGLTNEELYLCDAASTIPTTESGSLNLAQSVVVYLYEWFQCSVEPEASDPLNRLATHAEKQRNYDLLEKLLRAAGYRPLARIQEFMRRVKILFEQRPLSFREQKILLKALRYLEQLTLKKNPETKPED